MVTCPLSRHLTPLTSLKPARYPESRNPRTLERIWFGQNVTTILIIKLSLAWACARVPYPSLRQTNDWKHAKPSKKSPTLFTSFDSDYMIRSRQPRSTRPHHQPPIKLFETNPTTYSLTYPLRHLSPPLPLHPLRHSPLPKETHVLQVPQKCYVHSNPHLLNHPYILYLTQSPSKPHTKEPC